MSPVKRAFALGLITSAVCAAPASAGEIVFNTGGEIHVANEDGSNERTLITPDDIPGATAVYDPFIQPNSDTLTFTARTPAGYNGLYCGFRCAGVYQLDRSGTITRLSPPPISCQDTVLCTGLDVNGKLSADGSRYFFTQIYAEPNNSGTFNSISRAFVAPAVAGGGADAVELKGRCAGPSSYTPSPVEADDYIYVDCPDDVFGYAVRRGDAGTPLFFDDGQFQDLAWRPDGKGISDVETGNDAGIWSVDLDSNTIAQTVKLEFNWDNGSAETHVSYIGNDKVAFTYGDQIRVAPVGCNCDLDDTTPILNVTDNSAIAYSARTVPVIKTPAPPAGGGGGGGTTNPGGGTTNPGGGTTNPGNTGGQPGAGNGTPGGNPGQMNGGPTTASLAPKTVKLAAALEGLTIPFNATGPGQLKLQATLDAKTAKKLKLIKKGTKAITVAKGSVTVTKAGQASVKLTFTKSYLKKLRKAKSLKLTLAGGFSPSGGSPQAVAGSLTLKR